MSGTNRIGTLLIVAGLCLATAGYAELVITEIMSDSDHAGQAGDWWELTNTGPLPVYLLGYSWDDNHQVPGRNVFGDISIDVNESIIILEHTAAEAAAWRTDWGLQSSGVNVYDTSYFASNFSSLGDPDGVFLYDTFNAPVTSATYLDRASGVSNEWATDGTSLGLSVVGENGAYQSLYANPDIASPGCAVTSEPCINSGRMMYWTDKDTAKIQRKELDCGDVEDLFTAADGLVEPRGLAIDIGAGKMYWADTGTFGAGTGEIHCSNLDGSDRVQLASGLPAPADMALDADLGKIYFSEINSGKIRCINTDGGPIEDIITGLDLPYYIELDSTNGRIYWSDVQNTVIHRANLDGTGVEVFITGLNHVRDIVLDLPVGKIYWGDRGSSKIQRANLDGTGGIEDLFDWTDGLDRPHGLLLQPAEGKIYWTDTRTYAVHRGNMDGSGPVENVATGLDAPYALAIVPLKNVADFNSDYSVDFKDYAVLISAMFTEPPDNKYIPACDMSIPPYPRIDFLDFKIFIENWLATAN